MSDIGRSLPMLQLADALIDWSEEGGGDCSRMTAWSSASKAALLLEAELVVDRGAGEGGVSQISVGLACSRVNVTAEMCVSEFAHGLSA